MGWPEKAVLAVLPHVPKFALRRVASRYIAGERLEEAIARLQALSARGHAGIIDILGEDVTGEAQASEVIREYQHAADAVAKAKLDCYVSVKPTHCGLRTSEKLALDQYRSLCKHCKALGLFVRVEMEDNTTTDATLRIFEALRGEFDNVGLVLQSRLKRTPDDIAKLKPGPLQVRMVKGIYLEPAAIAHTEPEPIRAAYVACCDQLFARGANLSFATHDEGMGHELVKLVSKHRRPKADYEFQVLLGVQESVWARWLAAGHRVRVYVPFGPQWQPYSLRRMRKNPELVRHVLRQTFGLS
ncbi:MAG: proline dehydrogenase family protein [Planctomycetes bacterium]|nr:proline dehydrogenase family protein [Planctomycetota bacterium]